MKLTSKMLDGNFLLNKAEKSGLRVEWGGKGDHGKAFSNVGRSYMVIPARPIGKGLACQIVKWLIASGVTFAILSAIF